VGDPVARGFLRFGCEEQFMSRDLSLLAPTVRRRATEELPKALPDACISALEHSIDRSCSADDATRPSSPC